MTRVGIQPTTWKFFSNCSPHDTIKKLCITNGRGSSTFFFTFFLLRRRSGRSGCRSCQQGLWRCRSDEGSSPGGVAAATAGSGNYGLLIILVHQHEVYVFVDMDPVAGCSGRVGDLKEREKLYFAKKKKGRRIRCLQCRHLLWSVKKTNISKQLRIYAKIIGKVSFLPAY